MSSQERFGSRNQRSRRQRPMSAGRGRGLGGGYAAGPGGSCLCPSCGEETAHHLGVPCTKTKCPNCGAYMVRK